MATAAVQKDGTATTMMADTEERMRLDSEVGAEQRENSNFVDRNNSGTEDCEEVTRESLIAISYLAPEEPTDKDSTEKLSDKNVVETMKSDGEEKYRSKLISISYTESPDMKAPPVLPGDVKG